MELVAKQRYSCYDSFPSIRYCCFCNGHHLQESYGVNLQHAVINNKKER